MILLSGVQKNGKPVWKTGKKELSNISKAGVKKERP